MNRCKCAPPWDESDPKILEDRVLCGIELSNVAGFEKAGQRRCSDRALIRCDMDGWHPWVPSQKRRQLFMIPIGIVISHSNLGSRYRTQGTPKAHTSSPVIRTGSGPYGIPPIPYARSDCREGGEGAAKTRIRPGHPSPILISVVRSDLNALYIVDVRCPPSNK